MRLFLSCKIPDKISSYLREVTKQLPKASLTIPRQFDLTMKFFGEVSESLTAELDQHLSLLNFPPFEATLEKINVFSEKKTHTVWVGLSPKEAFFSLHRAVEKALFPLAPHDDRFVPHITLARVKSVPNKKEFLQSLSEISIDPQIFRVEELVLFQSKIQQEGAIHSSLFTYQLQ